MITLPARIVGGDLHAWCSSCGVVHVHALNDPRPVAQCNDRGSLGGFTGYQLLEVPDAQSDDDLAPLGLDLLLLARGWRECRDHQSWVHPVHGRRSTPSAAVLQLRLDSWHAHQLRHLKAIAC